METEIWKPINNYEDLYEVSSIGRVRSVTRVVRNPKPRTLKGRVLKTRTWCNGGYQMITLSRSLGERKRIFKGFLVHRLVLSSFVPNPKNLPFGNHIDGNKLNNRFDNLEWCTQKQNMEHASRTGLMGGEKSHTCKINSEQARQVKLLLSQSYKQCHIARKLNISHMIVHFIARGQTWKHIKI